MDWPLILTLYWAIGVTAAFVVYEVNDRSRVSLVHGVLIAIVWPWALAACVVGGLIALLEGRKHGPH